MALQSFPLVLKEFNLSTLSTSNVYEEWKSRRRLHDHGGLSSSRGHNEIPSWTVEHNRSPSNSNGYWLRSREEPESARLCVKICKYGSWHPYIYRSVFGILTFCFAEFDTSVICHAVFMPRLCLGAYLLAWSIESRWQGLKYYVNMFQRKVDNWKLQVGGHVTGLWRRSISGRNDLW